LSSNAMRELLAAIETAENDDSVGCILIDAEGPVYSAGHDLKELAGLSSASSSSGGQRLACDRVFDLCARLMTAIVRSGTPSIAVVQGLATAAGCQLVAACDLAVASESAAFATPGVDIGLFCSTPAVALSRNIPRKAAMEMLLLGERVSAQRALSICLVNRVVDEDELQSVSLAMASAIARKPRDTVAAGKANFYSQIELGLEDAYSAMSRAMADGLLAEDAAEGIGAFIDKRKPSWNSCNGLGK